MNRLSERQQWERTLTEKDVVGAIRNLLEVNSARVFPLIERIPYGKTTSTPGIPDLVGYFYRPTQEHPGLVFPLHFWIEVKRPGGKKRPAQIAWIEAARADGVIAFFADSIEAMVAGFAEFGIKIRGI